MWCGVVFHGQRGKSCNWEEQSNSTKYDTNRALNHFDQLGPAEFVFPPVGPEMRAGQSKQASGSVSDIVQDHIGLGCCLVMFGTKFGGDSASENNEGQRNPGDCKLVASIMINIVISACHSVTCVQGSLITLRMNKCIYDCTCVRGYHQLSLTRDSKLRDV